MAQKSFFSITVLSALMVAANAAAQQEIGNVAWSPDGKKLAFYATWDGGDRDIYVINTDGTGLVQLTANDANDGAPGFSWDGKYVLFHSDVDGSFDIFKVSPNGGNIEKIIDAPDTNETMPREISGGRIAFRHSVPPDFAPKETALFAFDPKTGRIETLINTEENEQWYAWPQRGERFFFTAMAQNRKLEIYSAKLNGSDVRPMSFLPKAETEQPGANVMNIDRSGQRLAIWSSELPEERGLGEGERDWRILIAYPETEKFIVLPKYEQFTTLPNISPDGTQVAFAGATNHGARWRIYIQDIDDGSLRQVWPKYPE